MSQKKAPSHAMSGVFVFLLLGIFAVFSTVMVLLGAKAYRGAVERTALHNAGRISTAYVRSVLRGDDAAGAITVGPVTGVVMGEDDTEEPITVEAITLHNTYNDTPYVTHLYVYDGHLREWFSDAELTFYPNYGDAVCAADELTAALADGLIQVGIRNGEEWSEVTLALRAQE